MSKFLLYYLSFVAFLLSLAGTFSACSDDDSSAEFLLNREISDLSVIRECGKDADSGAYCFKVRFRYPIDTDKLKKVYIWVDDDVVLAQRFVFSRHMLHHLDDVCVEAATEAAI